MKPTKKPAFTLPLTTLTSAVLFAACAAGAPKNVAQPAPSPAVSVAPSVTPTASRPDTKTIKVKLATNRTTNIARLRAYRDAGVFPVNNVQPGMLNIFIDDSGHICAAANLMWQDGQQTLVQQTADTDNFLRLATVNSGPLMDWMLTSGLTQDEIARIQEPYSFMEEPAEPLQVAAEVKRLQDHFALVLVELEANSSASLDAAITRLLTNPRNQKLAASL